MPRQEDVQRAAKAAHIHRFIQGLPTGLRHAARTKTARNLSQGPEAAADHCPGHAAGCANMLILDEATSNVDTRTEMQIQAGHAGADEG